MNAQNPISSILESLDGDSSKFASVLDKIIKAVVKIMNKTDELSEELVGFDDVYQTYVLDSGFNYWLEVSDGVLHYEKGVNPKALFAIKLNTDIITRILKNEISGTDAFMKGKITIEGSLSQGFRYIKLFKIFMKYLQKKNGNR
jgi:putative sterol carrier protein